MYRMSLKLLVNIWLASVLTACTLQLPFSSLAATPLPKADWQGMVDRFLAVKPDFHTPPNLTKIPAVRQEDDFDISQYFTVLDHLSMEEGYVLEYSYYLDAYGGMPFLYARSKDVASYKTHAEFLRANQGIKNYTFLNHIRTDGTPEGFFQYTILAIMGGQFYQWWHSQTNDQVIVPGQDALEKILADSMASKFGAQLSPETAQKARALDLEPQVEISGSAVVVKVVTFTKWGGFTRLTYTLHKDFPYPDFPSPQIETLVEYNCGIIF